MPDHDPLAHLLRRMTDAEPKPLLRSNARVPVPGRPGEWMEPMTRPTESRRNQAKVMALRKFLGIPGDDYGDVSQADYEEAAADAERRQQGMLATQHVQPAEIRGQYDVKAAEAQGQAYNRREAFQQEQQARQQTYQAGENRLNRAAMSQRQQTAMGGPMVPTLDEETGLAEWTPRAQAAGRRTGGSATEREAIQVGANTLSNIGSLMSLGDEIGWRGIGPTGGVKNTMYKYLGIGDQREDDFRVELQKLRADIMFGSGGKQLTTSEQKVAAGYLADIYTNPAAARSRLQSVQSILERAQARRTGQAPPAATATDSDWEDVR